MTAYTRRVIIVVPVARLGHANSRADEVVPALGAPTFSVGLTTRGGDRTISHYWCSWQITPQQWNAIMSRWSRNPLTTDWVHDETWTPQQVLDHWGLDRFQPEVAT